MVFDEDRGPVVHMVDEDVDVDTSFQSQEDLDNLMSFLEYVHHKDLVLCGFSFPCFHVCLLSSRVVGSTTKLAWYLCFVINTLFSRQQAPHPHHIKMEPHQQVLHNPYLMSPHAPFQVLFPQQQPNFPPTLNFPFKNMPQQLNLQQQPLQSPMRSPYYQGTPQAQSPQQLSPRVHTQNMVTQQLSPRIQQQQTPPQQQLSPRLSTQQQQQLQQLQQQPQLSPRMHINPPQTQLSPRPGSQQVSPRPHRILCYCICSSLAFQI